MNWYKHTVLKVTATSTCRVCQEENETFGHILSSCAPHVWSIYKEETQLSHVTNDAGCSQGARDKGIRLD